MDKEYLEKFGLNPEHSYKRIRSESNARKGQDYDLYTYEEYDKDDNLVKTFTIRDSTSMYPPFTRRVTME